MAVGTMYKYLRHCASLLRPIHCTQPLRHTMSTSSPKLQEWLCIFPDQEGAHERRLEVRPRHFEGINDLVSEGSVTWAGA